MSTITITIATTGEELTAATFAEALRIVAAKYSPLKLDRDVLTADDFDDCPDGITRECVINVYQPDSANTREAAYLTYDRG